MRATLLIFVGIALGLAPALLDGARAVASPGEVEEVEEIEEIEVVAPAPSPTAAAPDAPPGLLDIVGRLHAAVVHVPIGWLLMVLLVDLGALFLRREGWHEVGLLALVATVASFAPAIASGLLRAGQLPAGSPMAALVDVHRTLVFVTAGLTVGALAVRLGARNRLRGALRGLYFVLLVGAVVLVGAAGHWGGKMVYGENFLPF